MRFLVTRPTLDAARTSEKLVARGYQTLADPVVEIEPVTQNIPQGEFVALVFTSANAIRVASKIASLKPFWKLPVFAVGTHTAEVAREHGFKDVAAASGDVNALGALLLAELRGSIGLREPPHVLHLAGEDRAGDLAGVLMQSEIRIDVATIYRARAASALKPQTIEAFRGGKINGVLHYSERSAATFVQLAEAGGVGPEINKVRHFCLSQAVATPLKLYGATTAVAVVPEEDALLELLEP